MNIIRDEIQNESLLKLKLCKYKKTAEQNEQIQRWSINWVITEMKIVQEQKNCAEQNEQLKRWSINWVITEMKIVQVQKTVQSKMNNFKDEV